DRNRGELQLHAVHRGRGPVRAAGSAADRGDRLGDAARRPPPERGLLMLLEARGGRKTFGTAVVLDDLALSGGEHEVVALIGASGSGKSTLLRCISLLTP